MQNTHLIFLIVRFSFTKQIKEERKTLKKGTSKKSL